MLTNNLELMQRASREGALPFRHQHPGRQLRHYLGLL